MADERLLDMTELDVGDITGVEYLYVDTGAGDGKVSIDTFRNWLKSQNEDTIEAVFKGGVSSLVGAFIDLQVPYDCDVLQWAIVGDATGSIVVDVYQCTHAQYDGGSTHPVSGDKITASDPPTISSAKKGQNTNVTTWSRLTGGNWMRFIVASADSPPDMENVTVSLKVRRNYATGNSP